MVELVYIYVLIHLVCISLYIDRMDCSPPGSSVRGIFQARTLEQFAISFSRGSYTMHRTTFLKTIFQSLSAYIVILLLYKIVSSEMIENH